MAAGGHTPTDSLDFYAWVLELGLTEKTIDKLLNEDLSSSHVLINLTSERIGDLGLTKDQQWALTTGVNSLRDSFLAEGQLEVGSYPTTPYQQRITEGSQGNYFNRYTHN